MRPSRKLEVALPTLMVRRTEPWHPASAHHPVATFQSSTLQQGPKGRLLWDPCPRTPE